MTYKNDKVIYEPYLDFYVPKHKLQAVNWLIDHYPEVPVKKWLKMTFKRALAIYLAIRTRKG